MHDLLLYNIIRWFIKTYHGTSSTSQDASDAQLRDTFLRRREGRPASPAALRRELKGLVEEKRAGSLAEIDGKPLENYLVMPQSGYWFILENPMNIDDLEVIINHSIWVNYNDLITTEDP